VVVRRSGLRRSGFPFPASPSSEPVELRPWLLGWRSAPHEFNVLLLALIVWAFLKSARC